MECRERERSPCPSRFFAFALRENLLPGRVWYLPRAQTHPYTEAAVSTQHTGLTTLESKGSLLYRDHSSAIILSFLRCAHVAQNKTSFQRRRSSVANKLPRFFDGVTAFSTHDRYPHHSAARYMRCCGPVSLGHAREYERHYSAVYSWRRTSKQRDESLYA